MIKNAKWIKADFAKNYKTSPVFRRVFSASNVKKATLEITAKGIYVAELNEKRVGDYLFAPGYTEYSERHQYQTYDITEMLNDGENILDVTISAFWYHGRIVIQHSRNKLEADWDAEIIGVITIEHQDGGIEYIKTDGEWVAGRGPVELADIYDGEIYNATITPYDFVPVFVDEDAKTDMLIPHEGERVSEHEILSPIGIFTTPKGERVIDFGQNITGYPQLTINAKHGDVVSVSFAEILDKDGNFYNENYRSAICKYEYICKEGFNSYKPGLTFYGFRYIRVDEFPQEVELTEDCFKGIVVHSDIKKTGYLNSDNKKLNQLFSNIFWGQKDNFLEVPTDCPQRDERLGWTGDAQVFAKTATYNYDVEKFYNKWLNDMEVHQRQNGRVGFVVPNVFEHSYMAVAWSDAAVIIPWQVYKTYGDKAQLKKRLPMMLAHIESIEKESPDKYAWTAGANTHFFGDWLSMDVAGTENMKGLSRNGFIQSAFLAYDLSIVIQALEELDMDALKYREKYEKVKEKFIADYTDHLTQTECVLALHFGLTNDKKAVADKLAEMIHKNGDKLTTGFVGVSYLLDALSTNGHLDLAYTLLLQEGYPSWLFSVNMGATTIWEHWDGINDKGEIWSSKMNSFNHYSYGAVAGWVYECAAGIKSLKPGFKEIRVEPHPDKRLGMLEAAIDTRHGRVSSKWYYKDGRVRYEITLPVDGEIVIDGKVTKAKAGTYMF